MSDKIENVAAVSGETREREVCMGLPGEVRQPHCVHGMDLNEPCDECFGSPFPTETREPEGMYITMVHYRELLEREKVLEDALRAIVETDVLCFDRDYLAAIKAGRAAMEGKP